MTEQEFKERMTAGANEIKPKVKAVTELMMECYLVGFKTCLRLLTGKDFDAQSDNADGQ